MQLIDHARDIALEDNWWRAGRLGGAPSVIPARHELAVLRWMTSKYYSQ